MSDIVQPRFQGFSRFEGDQRSMFESAKEVCWLLRACLIKSQWLCSGNKFCFDERFDVKAGARK